MPNYETNRLSIEANAETQKRTDDFNFQFIQRLYDIVQTDTKAFLSYPHSLEQVAAEITDDDIEKMIKYAEWEFESDDTISKESLVYWYALHLLDSSPHSDEDPSEIFHDEIWQFLDNIYFNTNNLYKGDNKR